jgi:hypothetical protein
LRPPLQGWWRLTRRSSHWTRTTHAPTQQSEPVFCLPVSPHPTHQHKPPPPPLRAAHAHCLTLYNPCLPLPYPHHRRGELPEGAASEYESARKSYEALHRGVTAMAEALGQPLPHLAEDAFTRLGGEEGGAAGGGASGSAGGAEAVEHVFEDPEVSGCVCGRGGRRAERMTQQQ